MTFTKMHGLGNDYIYIDLFNNDLELNNDQYSALSKILSDRHYGVGSDGIIIISKSEDSDFKMRIFNSDGSEANMCGNGLRCASAYAYLRGITKNKEQSVETKSGIKHTRLIMEDNEIKSVLADLGEPIYDNKRVEVKTDDNSYIFTPISIGNPHAVTLVKSIDNLDIKRIGETSREVFIDQPNLEFVEYIDSNNIKMRVYERGSGETMSCGTGAAASVFYTYMNGLTNRKVNVNLLGGNLEVNFDKNNHIYINGPIEEIYTGIIDKKKILKLVNNTINSR